MHSIKTPTSIVAIDEPIKLLTQAEYDAIKNKSDRVYFITDNARKNVIGIIKSGVELNNFSASKIQVTPSGNITKTNAQEAIIENDTHIKDTNITLNSHKSNTSNPHKVTKSQVGLGNVDNTSDINKPVSTAQQSAIDAVNTSLTNHTSNTTVHITAAERSKWNSKAAGDHAHTQYYNYEISRAANTVLAAPNGSNGSAVFRKLVASDIPSLPTTKISGLGNVAEKTIRTASGVTASGWVDLATDRKYVPDMSFIAYWNGAYSGTASNLSYCSKGAFGTAITKNIGDFATNTLLTNQNLNNIISPGFYNAGGSNTITNKPNGVDNFGLEVIHHANGPYYTQKLYTNTTQYTRKCVNSKWGSWTEDKLTDTNTTYSTFVKSGAGAKAGLVPAPSTTAGTTKYLREDGTWTAPPNTTYSTATQSANGLMSATDKKKLDEMFGIITITKSLKLTTAWMDTGIAGGNLDSGTYVLQVSGFTYTNNNELYSEVWSGVMTWYKYGTNSGNSDEIILHNAGHADNSNEIYLRTKRNPNDSSGKNGTLSLQIAAKINAKAAENITFKFRRLI